MISTRLSTGDVDLDHLVKVLCARSLHCQVALLPFPHSVHEEGVTEPSHTQGRAIKSHLLEEAYQRISACLLKPHSNQYIFAGIYLQLCTYLFHLQVLPNFSIYQSILPAALLQCSNSVDFLFPSFLLHLLSGILMQEEMSCLHSFLHGQDNCLIHFFGAT